MFGALTRIASNVRDPSVVMEVAYSQLLSDTIALKQVYFDPITNILGYLVIKLSFPLRATNWQRYQAVAIMFVRTNDGCTVPDVISFGREPATPAVKAHICAMTGVDFSSPVFRGHGFGANAACVAAGVAEYTLTLPARMVLSHTTGEFLGPTPVIGADLVIDMFDVKEVIDRSLAVMLQLDPSIHPLPRR